MKSRLDCFSKQMNFLLCIASVIPVGGAASMVTRGLQQGVCQSLLDFRVIFCKEKKKRKANVLSFFFNDFIPVVPRQISKGGKR